MPRDEYESYLETAEILDDEQAQAALDEGEHDLRDSRVKPYEDVRRDLGLG